MASPETTAHEDLSRRLEELLEVETFPPPEEFARDALLNDPEIYARAAADPIGEQLERRRHPRAFSSSAWRSSMRRILPVSVFGSSSTNSILRG